MKVYIAGPMTHIPKFNLPHFDSVAAILREEGFEVVNPAELDGDEVRAFSLASPDGNPDTITSHGLTHGDFLARDVKVIADEGIEAIVVLAKWETSKGARHETFVAFLDGIPIYSWATLAFNSSDPSKWVPLKELDLFRAWTGDPTLRIRQEAFGG